VAQVNDDQFFAATYNIFQLFVTRTARITQSTQKQGNYSSSGEELVIVDLRHSMEFEADPETIPGAFRMDAKELEEKNDRLPRDREVILYCT